MKKRPHIQCIVKTCAQNTTHTLEKKYIYSHRSSISNVVQNLQDNIIYRSL